MLFGAPIAHEDHPQRALYAALRLQEATRRYSPKLVADGGTPLEARVGVNTGEVVMRTLTTTDGHTEYTPIGHTANLASRMQAIAPTGSIAITEHTRRLVEGYFQLKSRGPSRVKGLAEQRPLSGVSPNQDVSLSELSGVEFFSAIWRTMRGLRLQRSSVRTGFTSCPASTLPPVSTLRLPSRLSLKRRMTSGSIRRPPRSSNDSASVGHWTTHAPHRNAAVAMGELDFAYVLEFIEAGFGADCQQK